MYTDNLRRLRGAVRRKTNGWCPLRQCFSTSASFGVGFPSKDQCDNTEASPMLS